MKHVQTEMPKAFDPKAIEAGWYARWEKAGLFTASTKSDKPRYTICLPPPNVTGELHMGHALNGTVQDIWARYRRMTGHEVLFLPGTDHAAIATQNVIEKRLAKDGTSKEEIGRDAFAELVDEWYRTVGATIVSQYRVLGASLDWTRQRFTMDERYVRSVLTAFVAFYERGWIYRAPRIVNWCPHDQSAISDLEVKWQEHHDVLYFIKYPVEGGGDVTIATVRPETMLADTGVAVHPDDPRYRDLVGKTAILPLVGRKLPIVADEAVDPDFGTGALKVTPGHDPMDYDIGQRHHLEVINGMHPDGRMNVPGLRYDGLPGVEARKLVVEDLKKQGVLLKEEPYTHDVGHCDRCDAIIEPLVKDKGSLLVAPSGALTALPFHLLVTEKPAAAIPETIDGYRAAAWLVKRQAVSVLPSVSSLKALRAFARKDQAVKPMTGFGDPVFNPAQEPGGKRTASRSLASLAYTDFWQGAGVDRTRLALALPQLPDTAVELNAVAKDLSVAASDIHLGSDASETTVKHAPLADYRIVYFATHGLVADDVKGLAEPSLALSMPTQPSDLDDGLLTASEVAQLKLNADWVVLSACNTIAGDKPGAEALSGLARSFFYAGARALLVTHWAVDSEAATRLATATFDRLKEDPGLGRAEALRQAMLGYLNDASSPRNAYPAFWGPFALIGEGAAR